ncbi:MAG TPA: hypothetical protein PLA50_02075 [Bacteroidia bacterium]|nr:hypothetical protein [Bacteroidia bacterium]
MKRPPSKSFLGIKGKEIRQHGKYRTDCHVLQAKDSMEAEGTFVALDLSPV